ncbi:RHS repeat domain-containing protein [Flavobacterium sp. NRK F7]|uniref:RHS repeat domain-containing protein n=2 Tax=unclassified Flavobacterium TaxID=196869 RepID=UPI0035B184D5
MVTTYTYKPSVGVSTITDPKGNRISYHYDGFNRLEFVKDKDGNILSENKYHYKN